MKYNKIQSIIDQNKNKKLISNKRLKLKLADFLLLLNNFKNL